MTNIDWTQMQDAKARAQATAKAALEADHEKARAYLADTDWYVTRKLETNEEIPPEVAKKRTTARAVLSGQ